MKKTKKHIWLAIIAIIIAALAFGYAYLTTTLSINGITDIDRNSWDVYFDNVQVTTGSVSGAQEIEAPTITSDTEVEFHVNLKKPGDFYEFTIEARNDGTIDAMINSVSKKLNGTEITTLPAYLDYTVTYENGIDILDNHILAAESLETYKIRVEFKKNISASDLPSTAQSLTLSFGVEYVQADDSAVSVDKIYYSAEGAAYGYSLSEHNHYIYDSYAELLDYYGGYDPGHFKYVTNDDIVKEIYLAVYLNGQRYYLRGLGSSFNESTMEYTESPYYNTNKEILLSNLDISDCEEDEYKIQCTVPVSLTIIEVNKNGFVEERNQRRTNACYVRANGFAGCDRS